MKTHGIPFLLGLLLLGGMCLLNPSSSVFSSESLATPSLNLEARTASQIRPVLGDIASPAQTPTAPDLSEPTPSPSISEVPAPTPAKEPSTHGAKGFVLRIGRSEIAIGEDVSEEALAQRPGWLPTSARPGEPGTCVLYGHRNRRHFRALEGVEYGQILVLVLPDGSCFSYIVTETEIQNSLSDLTISASDVPELVLVTCYPFHYTGNAPQKFVVRATLIPERKETALP